jgi:3',5'-cyclic AMP phosphodiesterase CpdA
MRWVRIAWLVGVGLLSGCHSARHDHAAFETRNYDGGPVPWTHLNALNDPDDFQFVLVGDRTGGMRKGVFSNAMDRINLMRPEFVASVGDLIPAKRDHVDPALLDAMWNEFDGCVQALDAPFFYVPGNHDCYNVAQSDKWAERLGPMFYDFVYKDVHFIVLNSQFILDDRGHWPEKHDEQVAFVKEALERRPDNRWTIVLLHHPVWNYNDGEHLPKTLRGKKERWLEIEALLAGRKYTVFAGHVHKYTRTERGDSTYFTLATTGGGSKLRGKEYGEYDHFFWVTMTDDGPVIANLMLDGVLDAEHTPKPPAAKGKTK